MPGKLLPPAFLVAASFLRAQAPATPDLQQILQRLDRLEEQNRELMTEVRALREQLAAAPAASAESPAAPQAAQAQPDLADQVQVQQARTAQLDQEKIGTEHKLPLTLTGMLLENTYWTGKGGGGLANPTIAAANPGPVNAGATFRQTVLGVKFDGPEIFGGGKVTGSAYADFFGGPGGLLTQYIRLRVASINSAWKSTTLTFALDKPIIAPREPDSLAQVGVSPLTSAGNLWLWQPQVRVEQRFNFGDQAGLRAQAGVYQTAEGGTGLASSPYSGTLARARPGYEGRFELWAGGANSRRIEVAPGFHYSTSQVLGQSVASQIFSIDWLIRPFRRVDLTGQFFTGQNVGVVGGLQQGISVSAYDYIRPVGAKGGWAQIKVRLTPRLSVNLYGGQEDDANRRLTAGQIGKNQIYAGNVMYRFGSNILAAFEGSETLTTYLNSGTKTFPHYDLALGYLF